MRFFKLLKPQILKVHNIKLLSDPLELQKSVGEVMPDSFITKEIVEICSWKVKEQNRHMLLLYHTIAMMTQAERKKR